MDKVSHLHVLKYPNEHRENVDTPESEKEDKENNLSFINSTTDPETEPTTHHAIHDDSFINASCGSPIASCEEFVGKKNELPFENESKQEFSSTSLQGVSSKLLSSSISETNEIPFVLKPEIQENIDQTKSSCPSKLKEDNFRNCTASTSCKSSEDSVLSNSYAADDTIFIDVSSGSLLAIEDHDEVVNSVDISSVSPTKSVDKTSRPADKNHPLEDDIIQTNNSQNKELFVSDNPCENQDNQDPEWEVIKKLETDEERYKAVRKCWKNLKIPNPNKDLTYLSYRRFHLTNEKSKAKGGSKRKRALTSEPRLPPPKRVRSHTVPCTKIVEKKICQEEANFRETTIILDENYRRHVRSISAKHAQDEQRMSVNQTRRFNQMQLLTPRSYNREYWHLQQSRINLLAQQEQELDNLYSNHIFILDQEENAHMSRIHRLAEVKKEMFSVNKFYKGLVNNEDPTILDCDQMKEMEDIDEMYKQYDQFYSA